MNLTESQQPAETTLELPWTQSLGIAITGIGMVTPLGNGCEENLASLQAGFSGIRTGKVPGTTDSYPTLIAPSPAVSVVSKMRVPKNQKYMTRALELAVAAALEAIETSGLGDALIEPERLGIYVGSGKTGLDFAEFYRALDYAWDNGVQDYTRLGGRASRLIDPYFSLKTLSNAAVALISAETGARGPSTNFVESDTGAISALNSACNDLIEDRCDAAIVGGFDCLLQPGTMHIFSHAGLLAPGDDGNTVRPFDRLRDGLAIGEGAAFFVIERIEDARARGVPVLAELISIETATGPDFQQMAEPLMSAARLALAPCNELSYVVARGIGTQAEDRIELDCLSKLLDSSTPVTALKGLTGYLGAGTAAVELALGVMAAREGFVPAIGGLQTPEESSVALVAEERAPISPGISAGLYLSVSWGGIVGAIVVGTVRVDP